MDLAGAMIYLALPVGSRHGWGVCGVYLTRELAGFGDVTLFTPSIEKEQLDPLDYAVLSGHLATSEEMQLAQGPRVHHLDGPVLQATAADFRPMNAFLTGTRRVGYTFFEENILPVQSIFNARENFDVVVAGSRWCEQVLREYGLKSTTTVLQGIDPQIFNTYASEKSCLRDRFVVFSGGKFELRKGQDIVLRAYKVLQDKHPDTLLVASWANFWQFSLETMRASPYIRFQSNGGDFGALMQRVLVDNGLDPKRVVVLPPQPNATMARIYKNTDVGLFPNRCEGGTNLVLMEYMACGKPAIASFSTGHKDVLTAQTAISIEHRKTMNIQRDGQAIAVWDDPDLDETIHHLEWAYDHRAELRSIGERAGKHMQQFTWRETARQFYSVLQGRVA